MARQILLSIALLLALAGCRVPARPAPPDNAPDNAPPQNAHLRISGMERLELPTGGVLLIKPDHHMRSYDQLMVDPILVTFSPESAKLNKAEIERLETHLREATARELVNVDLSKIVNRPGRCVLRMQTAFLDVELPSLDTDTSSNTTFVRTFGSVTLVHELRDSMTGTVLLRYMGRRRAPGGQAIGFSAPWSGLIRTFDQMLSDLQESLVETVPPSTATEGPLATCDGQIYKRIEQRATAHDERGF